MPAIHSCGRCAAGLQPHPHRPSLRFAISREFPAHMSPKSRRDAAVYGFAGDRDRGRDALAAARAGADQGEAHGQVRAQLPRPRELAD
eukprot:515382-Pleurochrysis_carterae.AAC.1